MIVPDKWRRRRNFFLAQRHEQACCKQIGGRAGVARVVVRAQPGIETEELMTSKRRVQASQLQHETGRVYNMRGFVCAPLAYDKAVLESGHQPKLRLHDAPFDVVPLLNPSHQFWYRRV